MKSPIQSLIDELVKRRMISVTDSDVNHNELENIIDSCFKIEKQFINKCIIKTMETCDDSTLPVKSLNDYFELIYNEVLKE